MIRFFTNILLILLSGSHIDASITRMTGFLYQTSTVPSPKDPTVTLAHEAHFEDKNVGHHDVVMDMVKNAEDRGRPFHIVMEHASPLITDSNDMTECKDTLLSLMPAILELKEKKVLFGTTIEDGEIRKFTGIAQSICGANALYIDLMVNGNTSEIHHTIPKFVGKKLEDITYQDILDEVKSMIMMAEETVDLVCSDEILRERLKDVLIKCYGKLIELIDTFLKLEIDCSQTLLPRIKGVAGNPDRILGCPKLAYSDKIELGHRLHKYTLYIMDMHLLKRIMELLKQGSHNDILVIAGGKHQRHILNQLIGLKNFQKCVDQGFYGSCKGSYLEAEEVKRFFDKCLYDALMAKILYDKECDEWEAETLRQKALRRALFEAAYTTFIFCLEKFLE